MDISQNKVGVIADTGATRPIEERQQKLTGYYEVYFNIICNGEQWLDTPFLTVQQRSEFARYNREDKVTTSQPSPGQYLEVINQAIADGFEELCMIPMSRGFSQSYNSAELAKEDFCRLNLGSEGKIVIIDCLTTSAAQTFIALEALRVAQEGKDLIKVSQAAQKALPKVHVAQIIPDLRKLKQGGRIGQLEYLMANQLHVIPLVTVDHQKGTLDKIGTPRTWSKARVKMIEYIQENVGTKAVRLAITFYGQSELLKNQLDLLLNEAVGSLNVIGKPVVAPQPMVLSVYTGEDTLGLIVMEQD